MKKRQGPLENVLEGTYLWVNLWGRIMGKGEKHLNRMERDDTLLLLLSKGGHWQGSEGAGSKALCFRKYSLSSGYQDFALLSSS